MRLASGAALRTLGALISMTDCAHFPLVSVIIPAFNTPTSLEACLTHLQAQTYPASHLEIIVVDNGSNPSLQPVVARFAGVIYEEETAIGSYAARNRGLLRARGEILAFTDADCLPASHWIERGVSRLQSEPNCGLMGGKIALEFENPAAPTLWELCDQLWMGFQQQTYIEECDFAATANAFTFRAVFERVGPFNPALKSGGDFDWGQRVRAAGYRLVFGEDAIVSHPARASQAALFQKMRRLQGGHLDQERQRLGYPAFLRGQIRKMLLPWRQFTPRAEVLRRLHSCRDNQGNRRIFSRSMRRKLVLARWRLCLVRELEMLRILLGGRSRRR